MSDENKKDTIETRPEESSHHESHENHENHEETIQAGPAEQGGISYVTLVHDPFALKDLEISDAQNKSDELDLDGDLEAEAEEVDAEEEIAAAAMDAAPAEEEAQTIAPEAESAAEEAQAEEIPAITLEPAIEATEEELQAASAIEEIAPEQIAEAINMILASQEAQETIEAAVEQAVEAIAEHSNEAVAEQASNDEFVATPEDPDQLARIAAEMQQAQAESQVDQKALEEAEAKQAEELLALQIAEDQLLQEQLAKEAEEAEKLDPELQAALPQSADVQELMSCIEALLFMTDKPMSTERLHELLGPEMPLSLFQEAITALIDRYKGPHHGVEIVAIANGFQFRTKPGRAALAKKLAKVQTQRLSSGALESLAIVAYKQPVLKDDIDKIRGVDSSYFIRHLLDKKLIKMTGRSDLPGRPLLYGTTDEFMELFGLKDLSALPSLRELEQMIPTSQSTNPDEEDPRVKEMRRLVGQMKADDSTSLMYDPREDEKILSEIRERVNSIPTSTPYIDEQKAQEKAAKEAAKLAAQQIQVDINGQLIMPEPTPAQAEEVQTAPVPPAPEEGVDATLS